ncbi:MAG: carbon-nitrogen hydrolase family protein [Candidatus Heimdallarchaeota archaeon]|nr:carbon-nitrogen hydrolase family protein [Candidatus Heimdallarchaeota archaeon]
MKFQIALAQIKSFQADPKKNLDQIQKICSKSEIVSHSNTIVVFPELSVTGYLMHDDIFELAQPTPQGSYCEKLVKIASQNSCFIVAGMPESSLPGLIYNTAILVGPEGFLGKARKIMIPNHSVFNERRYFRSATQIGILDTPFGKLGLQICYDIFSPEVTRAHAFLGAHTSICISASPGIRRHYFEAFIPSRAMENTINLVYVNQAGIQDDLIFWGGSEARNAAGKQIVKLKYNEPDFGVITLDTEVVRQSKHFVPTLRDVPPWMYSKLELESREL